MLIGLFDDSDGGISVRPSFTITRAWGYENYRYFWRNGKGNGDEEMDTKHALVRRRDLIGTGKLLLMMGS